MRRMRICLAWLGLATSVAMGDVLNVPDDFPTIQGAIDAARDGDEIIVACGTYAGVGNRDIDFRGKSVYLHSETGDPSCVTVDCEGQGHGILFLNGESRLAILEGFTITRGVHDGAGILLDAHSSPTIRKCRIVENETLVGVAQYGGGILVGGGSNPLIVDTLIAGNRVTGGSGPGGAGIIVIDSAAEIVNCTITGNTALAGDGGGLLVMRGSSVTICNSLVANNSSAGVGGGVAVRLNSTVNIVGGTIAMNTPGGLYVAEDAEVTGVCSLIWGNDGPAVEGPANLTYCDVEGGWTGEGNIDADPGFESESSFRLREGSPCVDRGSNGGVCGERDLDGNVRVIDGDCASGAVVDMGAYEFQRTCGPTLTDTDDDGLLDGTEVEMAMGSGCPDPLNSDSDGDTLLDGAEVAIGTNPCNTDTDGDGVSDATDPLPTTPGVSSGFLEDACHTVADDIRALNLDLLNGLNANANDGRRNALANRATDAAEAIAAGDEITAVAELTSLLEKIDGASPPPDWMIDSPEKTALAQEVQLLIALLLM